MVLPRTKSARLAPFLDAIEHARRNGWQWEDVRLALADLEIAERPEQLRQLYQHVKKRREKGSIDPDQLPLPDNDDPDTGESEQHQSTENLSQQNSQEQDSQEQDSQEQDSQEQGGQEQDSQEQGGQGESQSTEQNSNQDDYQSLTEEAEEAGFLFRE